MKNFLWKKVVSTFTSGGDMSLVGTRPPTVDEYEQYEFVHGKNFLIYSMSKYRD